MATLRFIRKAAVIGFTLLLSIGFSESTPSDTQSAIETLDSNTIEDFDFGIPTVHSLGSADAPLVLIEFSDYHCAHCSLFHEMVFPNVLSQYIDTGKVFYVALHFPSKKYPIASTAAEAAYCAGEQGRFWEMRELLFANSLFLSEDEITEIARGLAIHMGDYEDCMRSGAYRELVAAEKRCGQNSGVTVTPSFILAQKQGQHADNGRVIKGLLKWSKFEAEILEMLKIADENP
ncbi:MAG: thioredoxin domain-containing protein [Opitutaceae bacterium]